MLCVVRETAKNRTNEQGIEGELKRVRKREFDP